MISVEYLTLYTIILFVLGAITGFCIHGERFIRRRFKQLKRCKIKSE